MIDPHADGVERPVRILEHHLHVATQGPHLLAAEARQVGAGELDGPGRRLQQPGNETRESRLPRPGLADESERLARMDRQVDPVDGASHRRPPEESLPSPEEVLDEAIGAQQRSIRGFGGLRSNSDRRTLDNGPETVRSGVDRQHTLRAVGAAHLAHGRQLQTTAVLGMRAARRKRASRRQAQHARRLSGDRHQRGSPRRRSGDAAEQPAE